MRMWLSKTSAASLRDQLTTQLMLAVVSGDIAAGEKLPSVRELARRFAIHPNTVSAAYRDLTSRGWVEFRKGSGVYAVDLSHRADEESSLDALVGNFFADARQRGFRATEVSARLKQWMEAAPVERLIVIEPEPELCAILVSELRARLGKGALPVTGVVLNGTLSAKQMEGAAAVALVSRVAALRGALPPGVRRFWLHARSLREHFEGQQRPADFALVGVASASPEVLRMARTLLIAAGLSADALEFRDTRERNWRRGLDACSFVIADARTAAALPAKCDKRVFHIVSDASITDLRVFAKLVTDQ